MFFVRGSVRLLGVLGIMAVAWPIWGQPQLAPDDPALLALLSARSQAESSIAQGNHVAAADQLMQSLRVCPPDRAELADAAYGNGQLAAYLFLHVMQEAAAYDYLLNQIDPDTYETDKMVKVLCYIAIGLNDEQKTEFSREASYLSSSENKIVRAITRFYLSNPYFYDLGFTSQFSEALGAEFPNLALTQVSLNFPLYEKRATGDLPVLVEEMEAKSGKSLPYQAWSASLRSRIRSSAAALSEKGAASREEALAPMFAGVEKAADWRERHFSLLLMKSEFDGPLRERMCEVTRSLALRTENTPDVLQARAILAQIRSADAVTDPADTSAVDEALRTAETLLESGVDVTTPERVLWETWVYSIRDCAENLAAAGRNDEAIELYSALIDRLPGSKIADVCASARAELFHNKPLPVRAGQ